MTIASYGPVRLSANVANRVAYSEADVMVIDEPDRAGRCVARVGTRRVASFIEALRGWSCGVNHTVLIVRWEYGQAAA